MSRTIVAAAILFALASSANAADSAPEEAVSRPWYKRLFGSSEEKPAVVSGTVQPVAAPTWKDVSRSLDQERAVFLERMLYCSRLRQIAIEAGDDELLRKADELEEMSEAVYKKRTQSLPNIVQDVKAAEAALDQRRPNGPATGSASVPPRVVGRSANGRPILEGGNR